MTYKKQFAQLLAGCLRWRWVAMICLGTIMRARETAAQPAAPQDFDYPSALEITNVHQVGLLAAQIPKTSYRFNLEGEVWWANPADEKFVLKDDSGAEELEMDFRGQSLSAGQRIRLEGNGAIIKTGASFRIGAKGPVVDNNGVHKMVEKSGAVFLKAGLNPIRVEWFNGVEKYGLKVEYEGPDLQRQAIPDSALFRKEAEDKNPATNLVNGLEFKCSIALGEMLPDFDASPATKSGVVNNFDLGVITDYDHMGICYRGFLQVPRTGLYTFFTTSDDGSRLFVGEPSIQFKVTGEGSFPTPQPLVVGEATRTANDQWVTTEGKVTFASERSNVLELELNGETGSVQMEIAEKSGLTAELLLNRRVRATGFCQAAYNSEGRLSSHLLLVPDADAIELLDSSAMETESVVTNGATLPLLVTAAEVHRLKREEAQRGYPVKIRGVVTSVLPEHEAFTIQDSTRGIYVEDLSGSRTDAPRTGDYLQVEGVSDPSRFAPVVDASKVEILGSGNMPEPIRPTWPLLINGSLDAQYVEIQAILTSVQTNCVILRTADGTIKTDIRVEGLKLEDLARYEDALIRVRGCLFATWDYLTHRVNVGEIRINGAVVTVDQPAPEDLFSTPAKTASELLLFDPQASVFQRVKVSGQIIHIREPEYFMMDGNNGVRLLLKHPSDLQVGDVVDAVGFPELTTASPVLREAVVRKRSHAALPPAKLLEASDITRADLDSTRVQIKAVLVDQRTTPLEQTLEMRVGLRSFLARLTGRNHTVLDIPAGSQLELTGTYASQTVNQSVASFELLIDSPPDVVVLARPPWWTLQKLLVMLGALACVLAVTVLWITQLHREVAQRTTELEVQIRERQRVEQQHAMEQERGRIAQDLHDELGSSLTEITMLGVRAQSASTPPEKRGAYLQQMSDKARQMVTALDEIVWAINPSHNSVASMVSYFSIYAERFLGLANITWVLEGPFEPDDYVLDSRRRHQLFLAFKEALTNVVRHAKATEVRFNIQIKQKQVRLTIADNGKGWANGSQTEEMDGVMNMRNRLDKLGGQCEISSKTGSGTVVRFDVPLNN
jgi:signal transduction histidine kinase